MMNLLTKRCKHLNIRQIKKRTRAAQHKLPFLACINPMPILFSKIATNIILKMIPNFEKIFTLVCRTCPVKSIDILDVDPRRDDDASPMSSYGYMSRPS